MDTDLILFKTDTLANIQAAIGGAGITGGNRRPTVPSDYGRLFVGQKRIGERGVAAATLTPGELVLNLKSWRDEHIIVFTVPAGEGSYTAEVVAPATVTDLNGGTSLPPLAGDRLTMRFEVAASANPTVQIYDWTSEALLLTISGTGTAFAQTVQLHFNGSTWALTDDGIGTASGGGGPPPVFSIASLTGSVTIDFANGPRQYAAYLSGSVTLDVTGGADMDVIELGIGYLQSSPTMSFGASVQMPADLSALQPITLDDWRSISMRFLKRGGNWTLCAPIQGETLETED